MPPCIRAGRRDCENSAYARENVASPGISTKRDGSTLSLSIGWPVVGRSHISLGQCPAVLLWPTWTFPGLTDDAPHHDEIENRHEALVHRNERIDLLGQLGTSGINCRERRCCKDVRLDSLRAIVAFLNSRCRLSLGFMPICGTVVQ